MSPHTIFNKYGFDLEAQFGSWPIDIWYTDLDKTQPLNFPGNGHTWVYSFLRDRDNFVAKIFADHKDLVRELDIIYIAGECAIPAVGRVFLKKDQKQVLFGYVMPHESVLHPSSISTKQERLQIIHKLCELTRCFHAKKLIHGDIKPANVVFCSDGTLRFIDFGNSSRADSDFATNLRSLQYCSPRLARITEHVVLTPAEDLYSLGMSIWEIFTGSDDFWVAGVDSAADQDLYMEIAEDATEFGLQPDMNRIVDPDIRRLIQSYLDQGPPTETKFWQTRCMCIETESVLKFCTHDPPHTLTSRLRCRECVGSNQSTCQYAHRLPLIDSVYPSTPICTVCRPSVVVSFQNNAA
ncbi:hypothetical protein VKT23_011064 [Stygiomarasmius scandens]|uniref:Protein kinase domain-containing protein n=1 Tax=Marasmiellus scandens TaxID=2682957 RepID=A0ABR1JEG8_9AGAR